LNPLLDYFWPCIAIGLVIGALTLSIVFRRRLSGIRKWLVIGSGIVGSAVGALLWSGPGGGGKRFIGTVEPLARRTLEHYEMTQIKARLGHAPLTRQLILEGPTDDFQRSELVRLMGQLPGVSEAALVPGGALPIIVEAAGVAIAGFLVGALLAYLVELHRRYNAQWSW
jgi:hypothetical protein